MVVSPMTQHVPKIMRKKKTIMKIEVSVVYITIVVRKNTELRTVTKKLRKEK